MNLLPFQIHSNYPKNFHFSSVHLPNQRRPLFTYLLNFFLDFCKKGIKNHENYGTKFSLINQFLYVFQCSFYVYVCFVYPLLCLQSIFLQIFLQFLQSQQEVGIQYSIREWIAISREKKLFFQKYFFREIDSDDEKETRVQRIISVLNLPRAFLKNTNQTLSKKLVSKIFLFCMCCVFYFFFS